MSPNTNLHFSQDWHDKLDPNSHSVTVQVTDRLFLEAKLQQNPAMSLVDLLLQNWLEVSPLVTTNYLKTRKASKAQGLHSFPELLILNRKQGNITLWPNCKNLEVLKGIKTRALLGLILSGFKPFLLFLCISQYNPTHNKERSKMWNQRDRRTYSGNKFGVIPSPLHLHLFDDNTNMSWQDQKESDSKIFCASTRSASCTQKKVKKECERVHITKEITARCKIAQIKSNLKENPICTMISSPTQDCTNKIHLSVMLHTVCICEHPSTRDHEPTARENKTEHKRIKQVGMLCVLSLLLALQILKVSHIYQQI